MKNEKDKIKNKKALRLYVSFLERQRVSPSGQGLSSP
jgi:hypothetical protein